MYINDIIIIYKKIILIFIIIYFIYSIKNLNYTFHFFFSFIKFQNKIRFYRF